MSKICDVCNGDVSSLVYCGGKKLCPDCYKKWKKGLIKLTHEIQHSEIEKQLNLEANGII